MGCHGMGCRRLRALGAPGGRHRPALSGRRDSPASGRRDSRVSGRRDNRVSGRRDTGVGASPALSRHRKERPAGVTRPAAAPPALSPPGPAPGRDSLYRAGFVCHDARPPHPGRGGRRAAGGRVQRGFSTGSERLDDGAVRHGPRGELGAVSRLRGVRPAAHGCLRASRAAAGPRPPGRAVQRLRPPGACRRGPRWSPRTGTRCVPSRAGCRRRRARECPCCATELRCRGPRGAAAGRDVRSSQGPAPSLASYVRSRDGRGGRAPAGTCGTARPARAEGPWAPPHPGTARHGTARQVVRLLGTGVTYDGPQGQGRRYGGGPLPRFPGSPARRSSCAGPAWGRACGRHERASRAGGAGAAAGIPPPLPRAGGQGGAGRPTVRLGGAVPASGRVAVPGAGTAGSGERTA